MRRFAHGRAGSLDKFEALIKHYTLTGCLSKAVYAFCQLKESSIPLRTQSYNAILDAHVQNGCLSDALYLVDEMKRAGIAPDLKTFSIVIEGFVMHDRLDDAMHTLGAISDAGLTPDVEIFSKVIHAQGKIGTLEGAEALFSEMQRDWEITPDLRVYAAMMDVYVKYGKMQKAMDVVERMLDAGMTPDVYIWKTLVLNLLDQDMYNEAAYVYQLMQKRKVVVVPHIVRGLFRAAADHQDFDMMHRIYSSASEVKGFPVDMLRAMRQQLSPTKHNDVVQTS